jgi:hypothetical protein
MKPQRIISNAQWDLQEFSHGHCPGYRRFAKRRSSKARRVLDTIAIASSLEDVVVQPPIETPISPSAHPLDDRHPMWELHMHARSEEIEYLWMVYNKEQAEIQWMQDRIDAELGENNPTWDELEALEEMQ